MTYALELRDVSYRYQNAQDWNLRHINLVVEKGKFIAVMGPNGAGKTTFCHCLNGLIPQLVEGQLEGHIVVNGLDTAKFRVQTLARHVGMVLQDPETQIFCQTVWEDSAFGPCNFAYPLTDIEERVRTALKLVRLNGLERRNTSELSGGQKQRLALAGVLAQKPEILVLDEPAAELDPLGRQELYAALDSLRMETQLTVIVAEQSPEEILARADEVIVLNKGEIAWRGAPGKLFRDAVLIKRLGLRPLSTLSEDGNNAGNATKHRDITGLLTLPGTPAVRDPVIQFTDVDYTYMSYYPALREINLSIYPGEFVALVGSNGAGKTTLAKHLNGLLKPDRGDVLVAGLNTKNHTVDQLARKVGYLFQNPDHQIFATSVENEIAYGMKNLCLDEAEMIKRIDEALSFTGLAEARQLHPFSLSRGDRQLLAFASIVALKPEVLVVDEPTSGLDWASIQKLMDVIKQLHELGTTVIMICHDLHIVAKFAGRVVVMKDGHVLRDGPVTEVHVDDLVVPSTECVSCRHNGIAVPIEKVVPELPNRGFLRSLDVRTKVIAFLIMLIFSLLYNPLHYIGVSAGIAALTLWAGLKPKRLADVLSPLLPVFLLVIAVNTISVAPSSYVSNSITVLNILPGYHLAVSSEGLVRGLTFVLRTLMIVLATAFLTLTTPVDEIVQLLQKSRVPPVVAFTITTALRFIPALDKKRVQILEAQRARGARLQAKGISGSIKAYIPIMVPLLIYSIVLANSLAMAMLNRGFGFNRKVTLLTNTWFSVRDYLAFGVMAIILSCAIYARIILRL